MPTIKNRLRSTICLETKPVALYIGPGDRITISSDRVNDPAVASALKIGTIVIEEEKEAEKIGKKDQYSLKGSDNSKKTKRKNKNV